MNSLRASSPLPPSVLLPVRFFAILSHRRFAIFPFAAGQHFVFSGYELDTLNSRKIGGTERREATYVIGQITVGGKQGWRTVDSTYYPNGYESVLVGKNF